MNMDIISVSKVTEAEARLLDAIKASDVAVIDQLLHQDLLFITPGGDVITKEMDLNSHHSGTMIVDSMLVTDQRVQIVEDNAVVTMLMKTTGKMMGNPIGGTFRFLRIWKSFKGELKVISGSCVQIV